MRVIVTRPQREAQRWVAGLAAAGHEALALPLIEVGPPADPAPDDPAPPQSDAGRCRPWFLR